MDVITFTLFNHHNGPLTKRFFIDKAGEIRKEVAAAFTTGTYRTIEVHSAAEFADFLTTLTPNQALSFSLCRCGVDGEVVTKARLASSRANVARTKDFFGFAEGKAGWLCLDYDPPASGQAMTHEELWVLLLDVVPEIGHAKVVWWSSAGSCIWRDGKEIIGIRGQRFWIAVKDAADIPRAGSVLLKRLWLKGLGRIEISKSGAYLVRNVFDGSVWDPARLDFASGSLTELPLEQRRGLPVVMADGTLLDTGTVLTNLTPDEEETVEKLIDDAKTAMRPQQTVIKAAYDQEREMEISARLMRQGASQKEAVERAQHTVSQLQRGILLGDYMIKMADGRMVSVGEILRNKAKFDGADCHDPLEHDYQGGKICGKVFLSGTRPNINSFAHGEKNYRLYPQARKHVLSPRNVENAAFLIESAHLFPEIYRTPDGRGLAAIDDGGIRVLNHLSLIQEVGSVFQFFKLNAKKEEVATDFPEAAAKMVLGSDLSAWPRLRGVLDSPFMALDGRIIDKTGYDAGSQFYLNFQPGDYPEVPMTPTTVQILAAFNTLWTPFRLFPFATDADRGAMVAALLLAVTRWSMRIAPGIMFEAPTQGSGKTKPAECVKFLAIGDEGVGVWIADEQELGKKLVTWVREGQLCHIFDNVTGFFSSAVLAGAMTTGKVDGERLLGTNTHVTGDIQMLWLATGNNASLDRDLAERWIRIRIDPQCERPSERQFDFDPFDEVEAHRAEMVTAALTILRAWHQAGRPDTSTRGCRFAEWSATVRACTLWLGEVLRKSNVKCRLGDPATSLLASSGDIETGENADFLSALRASMKGLRFTASDLVAISEAFAKSEETNRDILVVIGWLYGHTNRPKLTPQSVNRALLNLRDRYCGGLCLKLVTEPTKRQSTEWQVVKVPV